MQDIDCTVSIGGSAQLPFPVLIAAGTFAHDRNARENPDYSTLGGIVSKTLTRKARAGNPLPRIYRTSTGLLNSVGLANIGIAGFLQEMLPVIPSYNCPYILSCTGETKEEIIEIVELLEEADTQKTIWGVELNLSCPNVAHGTNFGTNATNLADIVSTIRNRTRRPLLVKLPPNVTDIGLLGRAAEDAGADGISAVNTFLGMWIDVDTRKPIFHRRTAGYSGEGVFPQALALVYTLAQKVTIPILGIGGITSGMHAIQFLLAGAKAVQVGSANFEDIHTATRCRDDIIAYSRKHNFTSIQEICML